MKVRYYKDTDTKEAFLLFQLSEHEAAQLPELESKESFKTMVGVHGLLGSMHKLTERYSAEAASLRTLLGARKTGEKKMSPEERQEIRDNLSAMRRKFRGGSTDGESRE